MTEGSAFETAEVEVAAPPEVPRSESTSLLVRLLPAVMSVLTLGAMAAGLVSGSAVARNPMFFAFPAMMLFSLVMTAMTGRGRRGAEINDDRIAYLGYLSGLRSAVARTAAEQRESLLRSHPDPDTLWTLVGCPRMWERRRTDADFCRVRVGVGCAPLATRLVVPEIPPLQRSDPVTTGALFRFVRAHSTIADVPRVISLRDVATVTIDGDLARARGLVRAMICQLAVLHAPEQVQIAGVVAGQNREHWDWLKWLPHNQHRTESDALGSARMVYPTVARARAALTGAKSSHVVLIVDTGEPAGCPGAAAPGVTTIELHAGCAGEPLVLRRADQIESITRPDNMDPADTMACARLLAAYRAVSPATASGRDGGGSCWAHLVGIGEVASFDPAMLWRNRNHGDRLRVPIGVALDGTPVELDIKEPAERGIGPHGLCVGATGSGKSELLRTVSLGMMARNSPEVLNLLLVDFKGGATFLDYANAPHISAVVTNLSEEASLVSRMRDTLTGEMYRRQQLLRAAGNFVSVAAYEQARQGGASLTALPTLFIIVDEFSELLSQHPDFADVFLGIGRLGRSLGMHLLLASQRLDEARLRGLEAHLSYRICLKTLSAAESRTVLGTVDAYQLPNAPGAGFLHSASGELVRFQTAFVSGPLHTESSRHVGTPAACGIASLAAQPFTARAAGLPTRPVVVDAVRAPGSTVLHAVLDRITGQGPKAHEVWLPPLEAAPALDALLGDMGSAKSELTVPIGIVDRPFEQIRTPLALDLSRSAGNVAVVGAPQSGKSTALRTLITALAASHHPSQVQFYCLDFGGGGLASMRAYPHVGAVAGRTEHRLASRIVAELESVMRSREAHFRDNQVGSIAQYRGQRAGSGTDPFGDVFLVVDGWARLLDELEGLQESITRLAVQGLSFGVHVVISASRWAEVRPSLRDQIGTRIELRLGDPADSELDRRQAQQVPRDTPGRGLSPDGLHMVIALPGLDRLELRRRDGEPVAPPIPLLPARVDYEVVVGQAGDERPARILLGLEERRLQLLAIDFERHPHLLVLGDHQCGKTAVLRTLCREIVRTKTAAQAQLLIVDFRRALLGVVESDHLGGYASSPSALGVLLQGLLDMLPERMPPGGLGQAQLKERSWWSGPDIYVVVDDYDLVAASAGERLSFLLEYLPYAIDLGLHLIVARRSGGAARAFFEPLLAGLRDFGCMELAMSGSPDEVTIFGPGAPIPLPPGRGRLVTHTGDEQLVQVAWSAPP
ncbi:type VII secretion protein EccCa [Mycobacterium sp.]|uniref:type VII secretion protein EccCa n=1 Tax=Mycobacterium sp. TaxID=1785 RepID=UPI003BAA8034